MKQFRYAVALIVSFGAAVTYFSLDSSRASSNGVIAQSRTSLLPSGQGFDFYVLALSWSPSYCQDSRARSRDTQQCNGPRPFGFVVHGLWPQFERGYPKACQTRFRGPSDEDTRAMLDIMPSQRLVQHQWEQHGACSGLSVKDYLTVTRAAFEAVAIPTEFQSATQWQRQSAGDIEAAFIRANPAFSKAGIAVSRRGNLLSDVRMCFNRALVPRACGEVDAGGSPAQTRVTLPPSRG